MILKFWFVDLGLVAWEVRSLSLLGPSGTFVFSIANCYFPGKTSGLTKTLKNSKAIVQPSRRYVVELDLLIVEFLVYNVSMTC